MRMFGNCQKAVLLGSLCLALAAVPVMATEPAYREATEEDKKLLEEILEANTMEAHLTEHGTFQENCKIYDEKGKVTARYMFWGSPDGAVYSDDHGYSTLITPTIVLNRSDDHLFEYFLVGENAYEDMVKMQLNAMTLNLLDSEELVETAESDDLIYMVTEATDPEEIENYLSQTQDLATDLDYHYEDGMSLRFYSAFNKENYEFKADDVAIRWKDGNETLLQKIRTAYDLQYDISTSPFAEYYQKGNKERQIQVVLVRDNGTGLSFSYTIPEGVFFDIYYQGAFPRVYTDPQCTQEYSFRDSSTANGITLYLPE